MNPLQTLFRQTLLIVVAFIFGWFVRKGILTVESADTLHPTMLLVIDHYLPFVFPAITGIAHQIYLKYIGSSFFEVARQLRPGATESEVAEKALGNGGKRTAAKYLAGVK